MKFLNTILFLTCSSWALTTAQECPKATIFMGGAHNIELLAATWIDGYADVCNHTSFALEKCGSTCRARNVCDLGTGGEKTLDVTIMTHPWAETDATTENGFLYHCVGSERKVMQVKVANDALVFAVDSSGVAGQCMSILGGLTLDQLRWIYSSYTHAELVSNGWDPKSLPNSDHKDTTHLWSELHPDCAAEEIMISGGHPGARSYGELRMALMRGVEDIPFEGRSLGHNETVAYYNTTDNDSLVKYVEKHSAAITFLMYSYAVDVADGLTIAHIQHPVSKEMVRPDRYTISSKQYLPFSSPVYMNFVNEAHILKAMKPFFEYAFSETGTQLVRPQGFVPIGDWEKAVMLTALNDGGVSLHDVECGAQSGVFAIGGDNVAFPMAQMWAEIYMDKCTHVNITYDGGSSSHGADRVCAASNFSRVDIGVSIRVLYCVKERR
jgi:ABC-type phosphate transport system substrate-binding protein